MERIKDWSSSCPFPHYAPLSLLCSVSTMSNIRKKASTHTHTHARTHTHTHTHTFRAIRTCQALFESQHISTVNTNVCVSTSVCACLRVCLFVAYANYSPFSQTDLHFLKKIKKTTNKQTNKKSQGGAF